MLHNIFYKCSDLIFHQFSAIYIDFNEYKMKQQNRYLNISKLRIILQPIIQILIFVTLYTLVWNFLYHFNYLKKHELWDLTTIYMFSCFTIVSLISVFLILKNSNYMLFTVQIILFSILTFSDFRGSPKIISIVWIEASLSILVSNVLFILIKKNSHK